MRDGSSVDRYIFFQRFRRQDLCALFQPDLQRIHALIEGKIDRKSLELCFFLFEDLKIVFLFAGTGGVEIGFFSRLAAVKIESVTAGAGHMVHNPVFPQFHPQNDLFGIGFEPDFPAGGVPRKKLHARRQLVCGLDRHPAEDVILIEPGEPAQFDGGFGYIEPHKPGAVCCFCCHAIITFLDRPEFFCHDQFSLMRFQKI